MRRNPDPMKARASKAFKMTNKIAEARQGESRNKAISGNLNNSYLKRYVANDLAKNYGLRAGQIGIEKQRFLDTTSPKPSVTGASNKKQMNTFKKVNRSVGSGASKQAKQSRRRIK